MGALQEIFRTHGSRYLERFGSSMPGNHSKVIEAIMGCRTPANGALLYQCEACPQQQLLARCCGNRHCPGCQQHKVLCLARHAAAAPAAHPPLHAHLHRAPAVARFHPRPPTHRLWRAVRGLRRRDQDARPDPKYLGADCPGFLGVLHTWGRQLQYHPHIHYLVPGGAVSSQDGRWHASSPGFYLPVHALSAIFRAKFRNAMNQAGVLGEIPTEVWAIDWNVNCQAVGSGQTTLKYLARYVFKVAISESRIVRFDDKEVVFRHRKPHSNRVRTMALPIMEFMRRFLQHVLPTGFMKVRYYGFLSPSFATPFDELKARVELAQGFALHNAHSDIERPAPPPPLCCRHCGGRLRYQRAILAPRMRLHALLASPPMMQASG